MKSLLSLGVIAISILMSMAVYAENQAPEPDQSFISWLLEGDCKAALESYKSPANKDRNDSVLKILMEIDGKDDLVLKSFEKDVGKQIELISTNGVKKIKLLSVNDGKIHFEEKIGNITVKSSLKADKLSASEFDRRLDKMGTEAKAVLAGLMAYRLNSYARALNCFEGAGALSVPLKDAVNRKIKPLMDLLSAISNGDKTGAAEIMRDKIDIASPIILLVRAGNISTAAMEFKTTLLHEALMAGQNGIAKMIVENGAGLNVQNGNGLTPLMISIMKNPNDSSFTAFLLDKGADINIRDKSGDTALTGSISLKRFAVSKMLIERGADVDMQNRKGLTPLMLAVFSGNVEITKLLLDKGADIMTKHPDGWSLSDISHDARSPEMRKILDPYIVKEKKTQKPLKYDFGGGVTNRQ